ncbi:hypothetical protein [Singulisphaera acidiphila]|uniref:Uncharacterized protein n=1 Tax=Singulisphaera acidiphila (strain ATCC BAA-1392 / DSM 18658 / VKM B-2454 / MOB10) TaxID=886293 RepID=L0DKV8_SINAD|nr:hypothetical protein [Singulisphaera acidiphila]AGA30019.1 hypothetical protein Sinac_5902 [Singulisphaera acidiphila DSM 18658]
MAKKFPRFKAGEQFGLRGRNGELTLDKRAADLLNSAAEEMKRLGRVSVTPPLRWTETADGRKFACDFNPEIMVKLSGSGNPYSFVQQQYNPTTNTWSNMAGGRTGTSNCYESKGKSELAGKVVQIAWEPSAGDWRFQWVGFGCVGDSTHICVCGCPTPYPTAASIGDDQGMHALTGNTITKAWTSGVLSIPTQTYSNPLGSCVLASSPLWHWDYSYTLSPICGTGKWRLRLSYGVASCQDTPGGSFADHPGATGLAGVAQRNVDVLIDIDCSNTSLLAFAIPTRLNGLTVPGGGGTLTVAF